MAEKNDDIKNLFMNLGLNPSDYHEIRTAPSANATVSEAPRRWSLLQAAASKPAAAPTPLAQGPSAFSAPVAAGAFGAASAPAVAPSLPPLGDLGGANSLSAALLAAAQDIARAETRSDLRVDSRSEVTAPTVVTPAAKIIPAASALPAALADAFVQATPVDGLQSLFQSVKEPQTVSVPPLQGEDARPTERRTDQIFSSTPAALSPTQRAASLPPAPAPTPALAPMKAFMASDDEPVTRHAPPSASRLGPIPAPAPMASTPAAAGRLRFANTAVEPPLAHGDSLRDVFRRLSRDNRA